MTKEEFRNYMNSEAWAHIRQAAIERDDQRCRLCYSRRNLQVHHRTYARIGEEDLNDLTTLCGDCHSAFHGKNKKQKKGQKYGKVPTKDAALRSEKKAKKKAERKRQHEKRMELRRGDRLKREAEGSEAILRVQQNRALSPNKRRKPNPVEARLGITEADLSPE